MAGCHLRPIPLISPSFFFCRPTYSNHLLRLVNLTGGLVTTLAGNVSGTVGSTNYGHADGQGTAASFYGPVGVAVRTLQWPLQSWCVQMSRRESGVGGGGGGGGWLSG